MWSASANVILANVTQARSLKSTWTLVLALSCCSWYQVLHHIKKFKWTFWRIKRPHGGEVRYYSQKSVDLQRSEWGPSDDFSSSWCAARNISEDHQDWLSQLSTKEVPSKKLYCITATVFILYIICQGCFNKVPQIEFLKQQKFILSQFLRLEVCDQTVSSIVSSEASPIGL